MLHLVLAPLVGKSGDSDGLGEHLWQSSLALSRAFHVLGGADCVRGRVAVRGADHGRVIVPQIALQLTSRNASQPIIPPHPISKLISVPKKFRLRCVFCAFVPTRMTGVPGE